MNRSRGLPRTFGTWLLLALGATIVSPPGCRLSHAERLDDVSLVPLTGNVKPVTLSQLHDRVTLLNFWGTWCPPCREEFPHVVEIWRRFRNDEGFQLLAVSCPGGAGDAQLDELKTETSEFIARYDAGDFPTFADPERRTRQAVDRAIGFDGYPTTLVIDRRGVIRGQWSGYRVGSEVEMALLVEKCLQEKQ